MTLATGSRLFSRGPPSVMRPLVSLGRFLQTLSGRGAGGHTGRRKASVSCARYGTGWEVWEKEFSSEIQVLG